MDNKKKNYAVIIFLIIVVAVVYWFYDKNQSFLPALLPPKSPEAVNPEANISAQDGGEVKSGNFTGMPLTIPANMRMQIFAKDLGTPRDLETDPNGNILVSIPSQGKIVRLIDADKNGQAEKTETLLFGLKRPHGLAVSGKYLFLAEEDKVTRYTWDESSTKITLDKKLIDLPTGGNHTTRSLLLLDNPEDQTGEDTDQLLISIGSSCNVCNESDWRRAAILVMNLDGSNQKLYASGLRNTVFMAQGPGGVWGTDMGRDLLGDNIPPEEMNIIEEGKDYGWPVCFGNNIHDTNFDKNTYIQSPCTDKAPPVVEMQAHSAPLGLAFVPEGFPKDWQYDLLVAFHGSWNRSVPTGYKIVRIKLNENSKHEGTEDFISGWLPGTNSKQAYGRPVDILLEVGGVGYISDDKAGIVYKIQYVK